MDLGMSAMLTRGIIETRAWNLPHGFNMLLYWYLFIFLFMYICVNHESSTCLFDSKSMSWDVLSCIFIIIIIFVCVHLISVLKKIVIIYCTWGGKISHLFQFTCVFSHIAGVTPGDACFEDIISVAMSDAIIKTSEYDLVWSQGWKKSRQKFHFISFFPLKESEEEIKLYKHCDNHPTHTLTHSYKKVG